MSDQKQQLPQIKFAKAADPQVAKERDEYISMLKNEDIAKCLPQWKKQQNNLNHLNQPYSKSQAYHSKMHSNILNQAKFDTQSNNQNQRFQVQSQFERKNLPTFNKWKANINFQAGPEIVTRKTRELKVSESNINKIMFVDPPKQKMKRLIGYNAINTWPFEW